MKEKYPIVEFRVKRDIYYILQLIADSNNITSVNELCRRIVLGYLKSKGYI